MQLKFSIVKDHEEPTILLFETLFCMWECFNMGTQLPTTVMLGQTLVLMQMTFLNNVRKVGRLVLSRISCFFYFNLRNNLVHFHITIYKRVCSLFNCALFFKKVICSHDWWLKLETRTMFLDTSVQWWQLLRQSTNTAPLLPHGRSPLVSDRTTMDAIYRCSISTMVSNRLTTWYLCEGRLITNEWRHFQINNGSILDFCIAAGLFGEHCTRTQD
jgi:hypothetical protein